MTSFEASASEQLLDDLSRAKELCVLAMDYPAAEACRDAIHLLRKHFQLSAKWRAEADIVVNEDIPSRPGEYNAANKRCLNRCANELESKLPRAASVAGSEWQDANVSRVIEKHRQRAAAGLGKYGVTTERDAYLALTDPTPLDEEWLRSVGFKPKKYQGNEVLSLRIPKMTDNQWIETTESSFSHGHFLLCRWSPMYEDSTPPDRVEVWAKTRGQLRQLAAALQITLKE